MLKSIYKIIWRGWWIGLKERILLFFFLCNWCWEGGKGFIRVICIIESGK